MDPRQFHKRLYDAAAPLIPTGATVVCAVSGGLDSVAMLHGLYAVNRRRKCGWTLHVAHFDHALRPDSAGDARFVERMAESLDLPCHIRRGAVKRLAASAGRSLEDAARTARYQFLHRVARRVGAKCVAVAHHADDQAETVLHHILRGTGLTGLAGMRVCRPISMQSSICIVRPLLGICRDDLEAYAAAERLTFREDTTNADTRFTRNRIRHELLPLIESDFNPTVVDALVRLAEQARLADSAITRLANELLQRASLSRTAQLLCLDADILASAPAALAADALRASLESLGAPLQSLDFERQTAALAVLSGDGRRRTIELPGGFWVQRRGRRLLVGTAAAPAAIDSQQIPATRQPSRHTPAKTSGRSRSKPRATRRKSG